MKEVLKHSTHLMNFETVFLSKEDSWIWSSNVIRLFWATPTAMNEWVVMNSRLMSVPSVGWRSKERKILVAEMWKPDNVLP